MRVSPTKSSELNTFLILQDQMQKLIVNNGLKPVDMKILNYLQINNDQPAIKVNEIILHLDMDRGWVYKSLKRLNDKLFISYSDGMVSLSGLGSFKLKKLLQGITLLRRTEV